jgi:hypothetical protein
MTVLGIVPRRDVSREPCYPTILEGSCGNPKQARQRHACSDRRPVGKPQPAEMGVRVTGLIAAPISARINLASMRWVKPWLPNITMTVAMADGACRDQRGLGAGRCGVGPGTKIGVIARRWVEWVGKQSVMAVSLRRRWRPSAISERLDSGSFLMQCLAARQRQRESHADT